MPAEEAWRCWPSRCSSAERLRTPDLSFFRTGRRPTVSIFWWGLILSWVYGGIWIGHGLLLWRPAISLLSQLCSAIRLLRRWCSRWLDRLRHGHVTSPTPSIGIFYPGGRCHGWVWNGISCGSGGDSRDRGRARVLPSSCPFGNGTVGAGTTHIKLSPPVLIPIFGSLHGLTILRPPPLLLNKSDQAVEEAG